VNELVTNAVMLDSLTEAYVQFVTMYVYCIEMYSTTYSTSHMSTRGIIIHYIG